MPVLNPRWRIGKASTGQAHPPGKPWSVLEYPAYAMDRPRQRWFSTHEKATRYVEMAKMRYRR